MAGDQYDYTTLGEPETGLWCTNCALPSAMRWFMVVTLASDPTRPIWRGWWHYCYDCSREWFRTPSVHTDATE